MSGPIRTSSQDSTTDSLRKRVCKACDRCRLKKSKCDGSSPCSRCKADNSICVFGERKKAHDKVYPKGYVEMLEQQQAQLVSGLQETYRRLLIAGLWPGPPLEEVEGHVLTHDILTQLEILNHKDGEPEVFEEDVDKLQTRLIAQGATYMHRRGSVSSDSEHSHFQGHSRSKSHDSPMISPAKPVFRQNFFFENSTAASSPSINYTPAQFGAQLHATKRPSPLHNESPIQDDRSNSENDVYLSAWDFEYPSQGRDFMRSDMALAAPSMQEPQLHTALHNNIQSWQDFDPAHYNASQFSMQPFQLQPPPMRNMQEWTNEPLDVDFSKFIQVAT